MFLLNTRCLKMAVATGGLLLVASTVRADHIQPVLYTDYGETILRFHASQSTNASFLTDMKCRNLSYLEWSGRLCRGNMVNYYQSDNSKGLGILTESYYRFNERLMLTGKLSYGVEKGKNMSGTVFLYPEYTPFDIVETDEADAGTKRREWYSLGGSAGYSLNRRFSTGVSLAYTVGNYAKFKDLRHQNAMMDLALSLGGRLQVTESVALGAAYVYQRNIQRVSFKIYGNTDRQYTSLISFGAFYGRSELFGESGYTSDAQPLFTQTQGGTFQFVWTTAAVKWFHEWGYYKDNGQFGTGAATSITYSNHCAAKLNYHSKLVLTKERLCHVMEVSAFWKTLENHENSYKRNTDANGVSQTVYYGSNKVGEKEWKGGSLMYSVLPESRVPKRASWSAGAGVGYYVRQVMASQYPFYRKQEVNTVCMEAFATKNWLNKKRGYTLSLKGGYAAGWGVMNDDGTYASVTENQKLPASSDKLLLREYDYNVAGRIHACVEMGYERAVTEKLSLYSNLDFSYLIALSTSLKGQKYSVCGLSLGVKF